MPKHKILIVDDDKTALKLLMSAVAKAGHTALGAVDGNEGLSIFQKNRPVSMVIADYQMPGVTGTELLAKVRKMSPSTVRVMASASSDMTVLEEAINKGEIFRFLKKPVDGQLARSVIEAGVSHYEKLRATQSKLKSSESKSTQVKYLSGVTLVLAVLVLALGGWFGYSKFGPQLGALSSRLTAKTPAGKPAPAETKKAPAESPVSKAHKLLHEGKVEEAAEAVEKILAENDKDKAATNLSAEIFIRQRRFDDAKKTAEKSLRLDPKQDEPFAVLGRVALEAKNFFEAKNLARQAIRADASSIMSLQVIAMAYLEEKRYQDALKLIQEADRLDDKNPETKTFMSSIFLAMNKLIDTVRAGEEAVKLDPHSAEAHYNLAMAYFNLNDGPKSLESIMEAEKLYQERDDTVKLSNTRLAKSAIMKKFNLEPGKGGEGKKHGGH